MVVEREAPTAASSSGLRMREPRPQLPVRTCRPVFAVRIATGGANEAHWRSDLVIGAGKPRYG
jgi:hypothetical protein